MGAPSITYESPKIEKDDTFEKYLQYQQDRELRLDERAQAAEDIDLAKTRKRREQGALGFQGFSQNLQQQVQSGITPFADAQQKLQDYITRYDLRGGFQDPVQTRTRTVYDYTYDDDGKIVDRTPREEEYEYMTPGATAGFEFDSTQLDTFKNQLQGLYTGTGLIDEETGKKDLGLRGQRFEAGVQKSYRDLFGRDATSDELTQALDDFDNALYSDAGDFRSNLKESEAYTKKFNDNYMDNYYDIMYGSSVSDRTNEDGSVDKLRTYAFDPSMMPSTSFDLEERTGITLPDYEEYFKEGRTVAELEDQRQSIAQTRDFIYSSGIKNLEGEIQKENNKIKIQGQKDIATINQGTSMYNLLSGFSF